MQGAPMTAILILEYLREIAVSILDWWTGEFEDV